MYTIKSLLGSVLKEVRPVLDVTCMLTCPRNQLLPCHSHYSLRLSHCFELRRHLFWTLGYLLVYFLFYWPELQNRRSWELCLLQIHDIQCQVSSVLGFYFVLFIFFRIVHKKTFKHYHYIQILPISLLWRWRDLHFLLSIGHILLRIWLHVSWL